MDLSKKMIKLAQKDKVLIITIENNCYKIMLDKREITNVPIFNFMIKNKTEKYFIMRYLDHLICDSERGINKINLVLDISNIKECSGYIQVDEDVIEINKNIESGIEIIFYLEDSVKSIFSLSAYNLLTRRYDSRVFLSKEYVYRTCITQFIKTYDNENIDILKKVIEEDINER